MLWQLTSLPECRHHVFLSHSREDHETLVRPVYDRLLAAGVKPWLDRTDYTYGRDSRTALRDAILDCRHVAFFVTDAMLKSGRGWCALELGYAELLQANLHERGGILANVALPLFLVSQTSRRLPRSVWQIARDRGAFCPVTTGTGRIDWCVRQVLHFLEDEAVLAEKWLRVAEADPGFGRRLRSTPGLLDRVTKFAPSRIPTT